MRILKKIIVFLCSFLLPISLYGCDTNTTANIIDGKLDIICNYPSTSSNPYDYIKDSHDFDDIVNMGNKALTYMLEKFKNSKKNGLEEYIMAIACSKILKENPEKKNWNSGKEWYENYINKIS